jgi:hypothetical protein
MCYVEAGIRVAGSSAESSGLPGNPAAGDTGVGMADGKLMVSSCAEKEVLVGSFAADWVVAVDVAVVVEAAPDRYAAGRMENVEGVPGLE